MRFSSYFLLSLVFIVLLALPAYTFAAFGFSFGGKITSPLVPCANIPGAFQMMVLNELLVPVPISVIWAPPPLTLTFLAGPPTHVGQTVLGAASLTPAACVVAGVPVPGFLMQIVGTSVL